MKNTIKCEDFRPINGLKTCEKIVKNQLEEYIEKYKIFSKYQSGFRKKHSCDRFKIHYKWIEILEEN